MAATNPASLSRPTPVQADSSGHSPEGLYRPAVNDEPEVETTNWNAVKLLASKYRINLRSYEEERQERHDVHVTDDPQSPAGLPNLHGADTQLDLGEGTPFRITAEAIDGGRTVFRFKLRDRQVRQAPDAAGSRGHRRMTPSSSAGSLPQRPIQGSAELRKTSLMTLATSRSIPALRNKSSNGFLRAVGQSVLASPVLPRSVSAASASTESYTAARDPTQFVGASGSLQGGDVLSAILGLHEGTNRNNQFDGWCNENTHDLGMNAKLPSPFRPYIPNLKAFGSVTVVERRHAEPQLQSLETPPEVPAWGHSPIPQVEDLGRPLFEDLSAFTNDSVLSYDHETLSDAVSRDGKTFPQHLRETQSFDSAASTQTTRAEADGREVGSDRQSTDIHIFDVFQSYGRTISSRKWRMSNQSHSDSLASTDSRGNSRSHSRTHSIEDSNSESSPDQVSSPTKSTAQTTSTSAAPGDDPRFVLWAAEADKGDAKRPGDGTILVLCDREGLTIEDCEELEAYEDKDCNGSARPPLAGANSQHLARPGSAYGRRRLSRPLLPSSLGDASASLLGRQGPNRGRTYQRSKPVLLAATRARLVAELTSEIDNRLISDFFYTYRAFMTPNELLDLLIARFHWALEQPKSPRDDARRRIVRVRTYVIIKNWLTNYFEMDFLADRKLRHHFTSWLNKLSSDPRLSVRPADMSIIKSLKTIVRNLKYAYARIGVSGLLKDEAGRLPLCEPERDDSSQVELLAARSPRTLPRRPKTAESEKVSSKRPSDRAETPHLPNSWLWSINGDIADDRAAGSGQTVSPSDSSALPQLPTGHSAISRAFVNTVGRLSRFKRTLGTQHGQRGASGNGQSSHGAGGSLWRGGLDAALSTGLDGLEVEASEWGDLLYVRGGVKNFMRSFGLALAAIPPDGEEHGPAPSTDESRVSNADDEEAHNSHLSDRTDARNGTPSLDTSSSGLSRSTPGSSIDLARGDSSSAKETRDEMSSHKGQDPSDPLGPISVSRLSTASSSSLSVRREQVLDLGILDGEESVANLVTPAQKNIQSGAPIVLQSEWLGTAIPNGQALPAKVHHAVSDATLRSTKSDSTAGANQRQHSSSKQTLESVEAHDPRESSSSSRIRRRRSSQSYQSTTAPKIVSIDDIDLSSDEDGNVVRRALRRLPGARDLQMTNQMNNIRPDTRKSFESTVSLGQIYSTRDKASYAGSIVSEVGVAASGLTSYERNPSSSLQLRPHIGLVQTEMLDPDEALAGYELVKGFRVEDFGSDDEEPGDVEEALRRLEGFIDEDKKAARAKRVEALWEQSRARRALEEEQAAQDKPSERSSSYRHVLEERSLAGRTEKLPGSGSFRRSPSDVHRPSTALSHSQSPATPAEMCFGVQSFEKPASSVPVSSTRAVKLKSPSGPARRRRALTAGFDTSDHRRSSSSDSQSSVTARPEAGDSAFMSSGTWASAILAHQRPSRGVAGASTHHHKKALRSVQGQTPVHHCFLLNYKSDVIAQQFCLIEAELFTSIDWTELASDRWRERRHRGEVLDWETFYRERVRARTVAKAEGRPYEDSAVEVIVARFNLMCNWIASEIVLTRSLDERVALVSKLIRVAWKCYQQSNFATLVQICLGLQSPWVERLRKTWSRVGLWEMRILRDLKTFTSPARDFRHLRSAMRELIVDSGLEELVTSHGPPSSQRHHGGAAGGVSGGAPVGGSGSSSGLYQGSSTSAHMSSLGSGGGWSGSVGRKLARACVPFFGLFLSDLAVNDCLPTLIDPTSPNRAAQVDRRTGGLRGVSKPQAFGGLTPLPSGVALEPLINVFKYRNLSTTIKTVVALQCQAEKYTCKVDADLYVKCLKVRCLEGHQMTRISNITES